MKKINLDEIKSVRFFVEHYEKSEREAEASKTRKRSEISIAKVEKEIARIRENKDFYVKKLALLEAEAEEAKKIAQTGGEILLAYVWNDDYGRAESKVNRHRYDSLEKAEIAYNKKKNGNGSYITAWIEVRDAGEYERIKAIKAKIIELKAELKALNGDN